jgi:hypothetical protein
MWKCEHLACVRQSGYCYNWQVDWAATNERTAPLTQPVALALGTKQTSFDPRFLMYPSLPSLTSHLVVGFSPCNSGLEYLQKYSNVFRSHRWLAPWRAYEGHRSPSWQDPSPHEAQMLRQQWRRRWQ